jgi:hypothetical protein
MRGRLEMIGVFRVRTVSQYRRPADLEIVVVNLIETKRGVPALGSDTSNPS